MALIFIKELLEWVQYKSHSSLIFTMHIRLFNNKKIKIGYQNTSLTIQLSIKISNSTIQIKIVQASLIISMVITIIIAYVTIFLY